MRIPLIAGNWKMFKNIDEAREYARELKEIIGQHNANVLICAPFLQLTALVEAFKGTEIKVGAQNVHFEDEGAFTGEISAPMLKEIGVEYCVVGHSERRQYFNETDDALSKKLSKLFNNEIIPVLCVGESIEQRNKGIYKDVVVNQLKQDLSRITDEQAGKMVIAYEPIWAIGTGLTASNEQAEEMCALIRDTVKKLKGEVAAESVIIQYGGSVKPNNASDIMSMPDIDGALVGGSSLNPKEFNEIIHF